MASKKKKSSLLINLLYVLAVLFCVAALLMPLFKAYSYDLTSSTHMSYGNAYALIFGGEVTATTTLSYGSTSSSFDSVGKFEAVPWVALTGWILVAVGALVAIFALIGAIMKKKVALLGLLACLLLLTGGIMVLCSLHNIISTVDPLGMYTEDASAFISSQSAKLEFGLLGLGIFGIVAGVSSGAAGVISILKR